MNKLVTLITILFLLLVGCSNDVVTDEEEKSTSSKGDIMANIIDQADNTDHVTVDFTIKQDVYIPEIDRDLTVEQSDMTYIQSEPFRFLTKLDTAIGQFTVFNQDQQLYSYLPENESYEPLNNEMLNNINNLIKEQRHLSTLLGQLKQFEDQMTLEENGEQMILTLSGQGDEFQSYVYNQLMTSSIEGAQLPIEEQNIVVDAVEFNIVANQESHQIEELSTSFEMHRTTDDETTIKQSIKRTYYDYQKEKEIPDVE
ncbi:DUF6612 family protein [Tenuibacillus multivorans]|uniref:Uncharacterized protein n=1 Tax=Tenuibacillus multivorans TaxID=237069 RepID=A0A1H0FQP9_9BACI|nr:DUF6612 family protein [Tenuibacillus multivorans]GEL77929.1 hypothetical protein TMU01_21640 [Tenuibacillus multivorans]SDN96799.1 hypothetical protein SAMN05216498_0315 [Tenuibacillus multivorans]